MKPEEIEYLKNATFKTRIELEFTDDQFSSFLNWVKEQNVNLRRSHSVMSPKGDWNVKFDSFT